MGRPFPSYLRIGDDEREAAISALTRHFAEGRITLVEHDERTTLAFAAKTQGDLDKLFADLPPLPAVPPPVPDTRRGRAANAMSLFARRVVPIPFIAMGLLFAVYMLIRGIPMFVFVALFLFARGSRRRHARQARQLQGRPPWQGRGGNDRCW
jgi:hypothetical protein